MEGTNTRAILELSGSFDSGDIFGVLVDIVVLPLLSVSCAVNARHL